MAVNASSFRAYVIYNKSHSPLIAYFFKNNIKLLYAIIDTSTHTGALWAVGIIKVVPVNYSLDYLAILAKEVILFQYLKNQLECVTAK